MECFHHPVHIVLSVIAILVLIALVLLIPAILIFIIVTNYMKDNVRSNELHSSRIDIFYDKEDICIHLCLTFVLNTL